MQLKPSSSSALSAVLLPDPERPLMMISFTGYPVFGRNCYDKSCYDKSC